MSATDTLQIEHWGCLPYREALEQQLQRVEQRRRGEIPDTLAFTSHPPVFTIGRRRGAANHVVFNPQECERQGIEVVETNRGGDVTYHGPGQIVGYLFADLSATRDLHGFLRTVEDCLIAALGRLGLAAGIRDGLTGVWLGTRKIVAIGLAARQWVSFHGFALNVNPDLRHFSGIVPCGIVDGSVTSLERELPQLPPEAEIFRALSVEFSAAFPLSKT